LLPRATVAQTWPVYGFSVSNVAPDDESVNDPSMYI
jgi:hypothetical protein